MLLYWTVLTVNSTIVFLAYKAERNFFKFLLGRQHSKLFSCCFPPRKIDIRRLPRHMLPSRLSQEAVDSLVPIDSSQDQRDSYSNRKAFMQKPTFIVDPFQFKSSGKLHK